MDWISFPRIALRFRMTGWGARDPKKLVWHLLVLMVVSCVLGSVASFAAARLGSHGHAEFNPWQVLDLPPHSDRKEIVRAYRQLTFVIMGDACHCGSAGAVARKLLAKKAFDVLTALSYAHPYIQAGRMLAVRERRMARGTDTYDRTRPGVRPCVRGRGGDVEDQVRPVGLCAVVGRVVGRARLWSRGSGVRDRVEIEEEICDYEIFTPAKLRGSSLVPPRGCPSDLRAPSCELRLGARHAPSYRGTASCGVRDREIE